MSERPQSKQEDREMDLVPTSRSQIGTIGRMGPPEIPKSQSSRTSSSGRPSDTVLGGMNSKSESTEDHSVSETDRSKILRRKKKSQRVTPPACLFEVEDTVRGRGYLRKNTQESTDVVTAKGKRPADMAFPEHQSGVKEPSAQSSETLRDQENLQDIRPSKRLRSHSEVYRYSPTATEEELRHRTSRDGRTVYETNLEVREPSAKSSKTPRDQEILEDMHSLRRFRLLSEVHHYSPAATEDKPRHRTGRDGRTVYETVLKETDKSSLRTGYETGTAYETDDEEIENSPLRTGWDRGTAYESEPKVSRYDTEGNFIGETIDSRITLPESASTRLMEECYNCLQEGHSVKTCGQACRRCGKYTHTANLCVDACKCSTFPGHVLDDCPVMCPGNLCKLDYDHLAMDCSRCCMCGSPEHRLPDCPLRNCPCGHDIEHFGCNCKYVDVCPRPGCKTPFACKHCATCGAEHRGIECQNNRVGQSDVFRCWKTYCNGTYIRYTDCQSCRRRDRILHMRRK